MVKLVAEMFRHSKAIGVRQQASAILAASVVPADAPGVVVGEPAAVVEQFTQLLATHRVWDRFPAMPMM